MDVNFLLNELLVPVIVGLVASLICTIGFYRVFRPKVDISKYLSLDAGGKISFKVANKSRFWNIYDITIQTFLCFYEAKEEDKAVIKLENNFQQMAVSQLYPNKKKYRLSNHAIVNLNIKDENVVNALLTQGTELIVQVVASHGWSCVRNARVQTYKMPSAIKTASFYKGNNTNIEFDSPERILQIRVEDKNEIVTFTKR